jgi:hypothetical protein
MSDHPDTIGSRPLAALVGDDFEFHALTLGQFGGIHHGAAMYENIYAPAVR